MQEGQDRSGDQPPEYLGAWSPIPAGDQPDRPADEPAAADSHAEHDEPAAPEGTWVIPAAGDQRSGTQGPDSAGPVTQQHGLQDQAPQGPDRPGADQPEHGLAGLGFGGQPGAAQPGAAQPGATQPGYGQAGPPQGGYPQAGPGQPGYGQPGPSQPTAAFGQPGYGQPGYGAPQSGLPQYGPPQYGPPQSGPPQYGPPGEPGGYGQGGEPGGYGQAGGYGQPGGYPQAGGYGQPGGYGQDPWGPGPGGSGSGWGSGDVIGYGGQGPERPRRRGSRALVYVVVAALAAGVGAGTVVALNHNSQSGSTVSSQQIPSPNGNGDGNANTTNINVQSVTNKVQPGIVDINSVLKYEDGAAAGTGMILSSNGVVLTNNHVVEGSTHLTATTVVGGKKYQATVLGVDPNDDVALIKLQGAAGLKTVQVGDSSKVSLGTGVVAVGNAGGRGGNPTVTSGTITAVGRTITASDSGSGQNTETIAEGDSGGALANADGQVIGMNTAANGQSLGGAGTSMGFAIPINRALSIAKKIAAGNTSGGILIGPKGFMGVGVDAVTDASACLAQSGVRPGYQVPTHSGALVCNVYQGTPAYKAGVRPGDVITGVSGQSVSTATGLTGVMLKYKPGATVSLTWIDTHKQQHTSSLTLVDGPVK
jgi:S1-C subfamily serine protease